MMAKCVCVSHFVQCFCGHKHTHTHSLIPKQTSITHTLVMRCIKVSIFFYNPENIIKIDKIRFLVCVCVCQVKTFIIIMMMMSDLIWSAISINKTCWRNEKFLDFLLYIEIKLNWILKKIQITELLLLQHSNAHTHKEKLLKFGII